MVTMTETAAKKVGAALILVGHVTREGTIAGPRVLEHLVDVVLYFDGDRGHAFRLLRAQKNRFGSTSEIGVFHMGEHGLDGVANPSELFLAERRGDAPGSCVATLLEGSRPLLVEIQALVAPAGYGTARRTPIGIDDGRLDVVAGRVVRHDGPERVARLHLPERVVRLELEERFVVLQGAERLVALQRAVGFVGHGHAGGVLRLGRAGGVAGHRHAGGVLRLG